MAVHIDEMTASVEPPETPAKRGAESEDPGENHPVVKLRRQRDLLERLEIRAERLRAD